MRSKIRRATQFAVCLDNGGYSASLEVGKLYRVIPDVDALEHGYLRVVDESGEDYGYSAKRFCPLKVPQPVAHALSSRLRNRRRRQRKALEPAARGARHA